MRRLVAAVLAAGVVASGCSSSTEPESSGRPAEADTTTATIDVEDGASTSPTTTESAGVAEGSTTSVERPATTDTAAARRNACETGRSSPVGLQTAGLVSNGVEYQWQWTVPSTYDGSPTPVVLDFHGIGSNGAQQAVFSGFAALAEQEGFVAVHPTGTVLPPDDRNSWELPQFDTDARDDVAFVIDLLAELAERVCIDQGRIYATGMSNGAFLTSTLVCDLADRIAAAVSVAGVTHADSCRPERPVPYLAFHGRADTTVPYDGGGESTLAGADGGGAFFEQVMPHEFAEFAADFGCGAGVEEPLTENVTRTEYPGCTDGVEVAFYTIDDGGHTWPGSAISAAITTLGRTTDEIDATAIAWEFFSRNALPPQGE